MKQRLKTVFRKSIAMSPSWVWLAVLTLSGLLLLSPVAQSLEEGSAAPNFTLQGSDGNMYTLEELLKENSGVVLAFFPRAFTPG